MVALAKTLPQRPRSRLVPLPEYADAFIAETAFGEGSLLDALARRRAGETGLDAAARRLQARAAGAASADEPARRRRARPPARRVAPSRRAEGRARRRRRARPSRRSRRCACRRSRPTAAPTRSPLGPRRRREPHGAQCAADAPALAGVRRRCRSARRPPRAAYTAWTFGELPELMEVRKGGQTLVGYPALIDKGSRTSRSRSSTSPRSPPTRHRAGLRRLVALQLRDALKYAREEPARPAEDGDGRTCRSARADELREQIVEVALDRAFLAEPLPTDAAAFARRHRGRPRPADADRQRGGARSPASCSPSTHAAQRKLKDARPAKDVADDIAQQLERLVPKRFVVDDAVGAAAAPAALPEGDRRCGSTSCAPIRRATRRAWPSCARSSSAT